MGQTLSSFEVSDMHMEGHSHQIRKAYMLEF